jgi:hypothetical protein
MLKTRDIPSEMASIIRALLVTSITEDSQNAAIKAHLASAPARLIKNLSGNPIVFSHCDAEGACDGPCNAIETVFQSADLLAILETL